MSQKNKIIIIIAIVLYSTVLSFTVDLATRTQLSNKGVFFTSSSKDFFVDGQTKTGCATAYKTREDTDNVTLIEYTQTEEECSEKMSEEVITQAELENKLLNYEDRIVPNSRNYDSTLINNNLLID